MASDNCSVTITRNGVPAGNFFPVGITNITYTATDNCGAVNTRLSVSSNEPADGTGDGDAAPDWEVSDSDPHHVRLRAERSGQGGGRVYTITITAADSHGNTSSQVVTVRVPHN